MFQTYKKWVTMHKRILAILGVVLLLVGGLWPAKPAVQAQEDAPVVLPNCIAVVGDSLAAGTLVVQLPGINFVTIQTRPLAVVVDDELETTPYATVPVLDFGMPAGFLSPDGLRPYRDSPSYTALMAAACDVVVMTAWNNDLRVTRDDGPAAYVQDVADLIDELRAVNPTTRALIWTHFWGVPQSFVEGYGGGITYNNSQLHRIATLEACEVDGLFYEMGRISCVDLDLVFEDEPIFNVVIGTMSRSYFNSLLYGGLSEEERGYVDFFFNQNATNQAVGDGVHFTEYGKRVLARSVITFLNSPAEPETPARNVPTPPDLDSKDTGY